MNVGLTGSSTDNSIEGKLRKSQNDLGRAINILRSQFMVDRVGLADDLENIQDILEEAINAILK